MKKSLVSDVSQRDLRDYASVIVVIVSVAIGIMVSILLLKIV